MMLAEQPARVAGPPPEDSSSSGSYAGYAYAEDIPGTRCGPEDGPWPRSYVVLEEEGVWNELRTLAKPHSLPLGRDGKYRADSVNFQPSPSTKTQDRYVVTQLEVNGRLWSLTGVFDGVHERPLNGLKLLTYFDRPPRRCHCRTCRPPFTHHCA